MQKPGIPSGTRDFNSVEMQKRNFIFDTIKRHFKLYGFEQIETPAMENLSTLTGKYGEEGDQLLFKILNSRMYDSKKKEKLREEFEKTLEKSYNSGDLTERALRYDLTVPFARYVVMHQNEITFPFKRYQIQPVWRADKPQRGRYREFYQCDADVIGSKSLVNEIELLKMVDDVFSDFNLSVIIKLNNRKVLSGIAEIIAAPDKIVDITVAIDKLDKIGLEKVNEELVSKGISSEAITKLQPIFLFKGDNSERIAFLRSYLSSSAIGLQGVDELEYVLNALSKADLNKAILEIDITLARGLNYYTGSIIEVKANEGDFTSSICGGGRYDDLTGIFGLKDMSGVGISFGIDRILDVLNDLKRFDTLLKSTTNTKVLFANFGEAEQAYILPLLTQLRKSEIACELYPEAAKMKKQFDYADKKQIPFVCVVGSDEMQSGQLSIKTMTTGVQQKLSIQEIIKMLAE